LLGASTHVSQTALPSIVRRNAVAVVPDVNAQFVGGGDFDGQTGCAGMPKNVADGFCDDSFGVLGEFSINSGQFVVISYLMSERR
jgi:hypothetical protein